MQRGVLYCYMFAQVWVELAQKSLRILTSAQPFIAQRHDSYIMIQGLTGGPGVVESLHDRALLARVANGVFNSVKNVLSRCRATSRPCVARRRAVVSLGTVAVLLHYAVGPLGTVAMHREWLPDARLVGI
jgi:hypothetical protein